jgi:hypothetical protein
VNRSLAEGRERFRRLLSRSESGDRCDDLMPLLSAYCDGEAGAEGETVVREHLRACAACRATMRSYRATPAAVGALAPVVPVSRSLLDRAHELLVSLHARLLPGAAGGGDGGIAQVAAAGGSRGVGMAALAKALAICAGTVGGAAACIATGVAPMPIGIHPEQSAGAKVERVSRRAVEEVEPPATEYQPAPPQSHPQPAPEPEPQPEPEPEPEPEPTAATESTEAGAVEYTPPPESVAPAPIGEPSSGSSGASGSAAGEFGP